MAGRGRQPGFQMGAEHRTKIANSKVLKHLIDHATGKRDMTSTQVTAALGLLDRVMPKLQSTTLDGDVSTTIIRKTVYEAKPD
jgi:hypothetical protein